MKATIVLPTYNEAENIEDFLNEIYKVIPQIGGFEINTLIVDDNSPDGTANIVKRLQETNSNIHLLFECVNLGAKTYEIPINFIDRIKGKSKLSIKDVIEFMLNSFDLFIRRFK